jgi:hypothetical protein
VCNPNKHALETHPDGVYRYGWMDGPVPFSKMTRQREGEAQCVGQLRMIQGTFDVIQGTFNAIQGTFGVIHGFTHPPQLARPPPRHTSVPSP